jgi:hypothetical protein
MSAAIRQQRKLLWQNQGKRQTDSGQPQDERLDKRQAQAGPDDEIKRIVHSADEITAPPPSGKRKRKSPRLAPWA